MTHTHTYIYITYIYVAYMCVCVSVRVCVRAYICVCWVCFLNDLVVKIKSNYKSLNYFHCRDRFIGSIFSIICIAPKLANCENVRIDMPTTNEVDLYPTSLYVTLILESLCMQFARSSAFHAYMPTILFANFNELKYTWTLTFLSN